MLYGLDGASWQGYPDWDRLKLEAHDFMIWKATGEGTYVNPSCGTNLERAYAAGLVTGTYDWFEPQDAARFNFQGELAAEDYLRVVDRLGGFRPGHLLAVDWESPEWFTGPLGRNIEEYCRRYWQRLMQEQTVVTYTAPYFLKETGSENWDWLTQSIYWIAAPGPTGMLDDNASWPGGKLVNPWGQALFHQHQWYGTSDAVAGHFDRDRFNGNLLDLLRIGYRGEGGGPYEEGEVKEPPAEHVTAYINDRGETILVANMGGFAKSVEGVNWQDLGVSVVNDAIYDRSIKEGAFLPWKRRD